MDPGHIAEMLRPFLAGPSVISSLGNSQATSATRKPAVVSPAQLHCISIYIDLLLRWNRRINLTAVRETEEIVTRHFGESLFAACLLFPIEDGVATPDPGPLLHLVDVGSGAGFPGLPVKIWAPQLRLTLIESNQKKVAFLREVIRALRLSDVNVFSGRAADFPPGSADIVTLRAVENFEGILGEAVSLLAPSGGLALLIGRSQTPLACQLTPELLWQDPVVIPLSINRVLMVGSKQESPAIKRPSQGLPDEPR